MKRLKNIDLNILSFDENLVVANNKERKGVIPTEVQTKVSEYMEMRRGNILDGVSSTAISLIDGSLITNSATLLTDGVWVWPYIISYYIREAAYMLPNQFEKYLLNKDLSYCNFSNHIRYISSIQRQKKLFALGLWKRGEEFSLKEKIDTFNIKRSIFGERMPFQHKNFFFDRSFQNHSDMENYIDSIPNVASGMNEIWIFDSNGYLIEYSYDRQFEDEIVKKHSFTKKRWFFLPNSIKVPPRPVDSY